MLKTPKEKNNDSSACHVQKRHSLPQSPQASWSASGYPAVASVSVGFSTGLKHLLFGWLLKDWGASNGRKSLEKSLVCRLLLRLLGQWAVAGRDFEVMDNMIFLVL